MIDSVAAAVHAVADAGMIGGDKPLTSAGGWRVMLLEGLKVVELATWIAGPGCAAIMADWGADVIKVESGAGDPVRLMAPDSPGSPNPIFAMENRGKRGVVLDLTADEGRAAMLALLAEADIFISNVRPGALKRLGLDYDSLKGSHPRLIYACITGYGLEGPDANTPAFDITAFWSRSGIARATIPPDQQPFPCRPGFGDHVTALATLSAILAAVHERHATGRGRLVEASLMRTATYAIGWDLSVALKNGTAVTALPRNNRPDPISGYFRTRDDRWICFVPRGDRCFVAMMGLIGRAEVLDDPAFARPLLDLERVRDLRASVDAWVGALTLEEAGAQLSAVDFIWSPMASLEQFADDPQAEQAGCFVALDDGQGGTFRSPAAPVRFPEGAPAVTRGAPGLGEHTADILAALSARG